jgi:hypothetical protein
MKQEESVMMKSQLERSQMQKITVELKNLVAGLYGWRMNDRW